jgi:hypothetical protein
MVTTLLAILFVIPLMARQKSKEGENNNDREAAAE